MRSLTLDARMRQSGGIGTFLIQIIEALSSEFNLTLLIYKKDLALFQNFSRCTFIFMHSPIYSLYEQGELWRKIPSTDFFFSPHFNIPLLPIRAKKRIVTLHDVYHLAHPLPWHQKIVASLLYRSAVKLSHFVTTDSHFSAQEIKRYLGVTAHVIYPAIPTWITKPIKGLPLSSEKYILAVGNVKPHKNLQRLIQAYKKLRRPERLLIVGRKNGLITQDHFEESEGVIMTGFVKEEDLPALYAHASLFVFPSLYEGFGFPPLEAMALGCVVLASNAASIPEVCKEGAYYINPLSVDEMAKGITICLENEVLRKKLIEKGKEVAYSYTLEKFKEGYLKVLHENCHSP